MPSRSDAETGKVALGDDVSGSSSFEAFVSEVEPRLRHALCVACGPEDGRDATAAALAWAWEHWSRVQGMDNPAGYLYRVGQSATRRRRVPVLPPVDPVRLPTIDPGLPAALAKLTEKQRVVVVLVHAGEWRLTEVADLLSVSVSTARNHLARGMAKLRADLEVER